MVKTTNLVLNGKVFVYGEDKYSNRKLVTLKCISLGLNLEFNYKNADYVIMNLNNKYNKTMK